MIPTYARSFAPRNAPQQHRTPNRTLLRRSAAMAKQRGPGAAPRGTLVLASVLLLLAAAEARPVLELSGMIVARRGGPVEGARLRAAVASLSCGGAVPRLFELAPADPHTRP